MNRKNYTAASCVLLCSISLCACASAPSSSAVVPKNAERLAQQATDSSAKDREALSDLKQETTSHYSFDYESDDKTVSIHADCPVIMPDTNQIPSYRINGDGFTQEQASGMYNLLLKGKNPYHLDFSGEKIPSDGTLQTYTQIYEGLDNSYTGLDVTSDDGYFSLINSFTSSSDTSPNFMYGRDTSETGMYFDGSVGPAVSEEEVDSLLSPSVSVHLADAKQLAEEFFAAVNIEAVLQQVYLVSLADSSASTPEKGAYEDDYSAMQLIYSPAINSVPVGTSMDNTISDYSISWPIERISFVVSDLGIIEIRWQSPTQIVETLSENTSLISFEQASSIFEEMCPLVYAGKAASIPNANYHITVDKAELCLFRVRDSGNNRTGLLVPTWIFYGDEGFSVNNSEPSSSYPPYILLAINAVDQTIIDVTQGY